MLLLEATIYLDTPSQNANALTKDLAAKHVLRPAINFGNGLLFSGEILARDEVDILYRGRTYEVLIHMFTIEEEAFEAIGHLVKVGASFSICAGSRVVGKGTILDVVYE